MRRECKLMRETTESEKRKKASYTGKVHLQMKRKYERGRRNRKGWGKVDGERERDRVG